MQRHTARPFDFGPHRAWHWLDVDLILNPWRGEQYQSLPVNIKFSLGTLNLAWVQLPHGNASQGFYYCFWTAGQQQLMCGSTTLCTCMCAVCLRVYISPIKFPFEKLRPIAPWWTIKWVQMKSQTYSHAWTDSSMHVMNAHVLPLWWRPFAVQQVSTAFFFPFYDLYAVGHHITPTNSPRITSWTAASASTAALQH